MTKVTDSLRLKALAAYTQLKANARLDGAENQIKIDALASAAVLVAASTANELMVGVRASLLEAAAETGRYFFLFDLTDVATTLETKHFDISKLRADEVRAVEQALRSFNKKLADTTTTSDHTTKLARKALQSIATLSQQLTTAFAKRRQDTVLTGSDLYNYLSKSRSDTTTVSDQAINLTGKAATDTFSASDAYSRTVAYVREFSDSADATDEISVVAQTDDGQVMFLNKVLIDPVATAESHQFDISALRSVSFIAIDQAVQHLTKPRSDAVATADSTEREAGKALDESALTADDHTFAVQRVSTDTVSSVEVVARAITKTLNDVVNTSDTLSRIFGKSRQDGVSTEEFVDVIRIAANGVPPQIENQTVSDLYAPNVFKNFAETLTVSDDFDGATTTEDNQTTAFTKGLSEPLSALEQRTAFLQKPTAEALAANDSGVLFWTNYCDSTYFSQGYVGQERSFT